MVLLTTVTDAVRLPTDHVVELGRDRYVLRPLDAAGCSRLDMYRDGKLRHGYLAKPVNTDQLLSLLRVWLYR